MEQKLFTELRPLYVTSKENPNEIRIRIRMRDLIDPAILRCGYHYGKISVFLR